MFSYSGQGGFVVRLTYLLLTFFFHLAIFLVALVGLAHYWFPMVDDYKGILEKELSDFVGNQVSIGQIRVDRDSEEPHWIIENLQLTEPDGYSPIQIQQLTLSLDWQESLRTLRLQPGEVQLEGVEFVLRQRPDELPEVRGLSFPLPGQKNTALDIERKSPIRVSINGGYVHWEDDASSRSLTLSDLQFIGEFLPDEITLQADALFPPEIGETLGVDAVLYQVETSDGKTDWDANLHTRTRIFNIAALPSPLIQKYGVHSGSLDVDAKIRAISGKPLHISGEGEINYLSWQGNADIPGVNGVNASFTASNDGGKVNITVNDSVFDFPKWFETRLLIDHMNSDLQWTVKDDGWHWQMTHLKLQNPDLQAEGSGSLDISTDHPPDINLNMRFSTRRTVDNVRHYIPAIIADSTEEWLKYAILHGYVPRGEFTLRGNPADFPFKQKPGVFDIRFDIEKGVLAYLPEWPEARDVTGELHFHNEGMSATVNSARIMDLSVKGGSVDIPNMTKNAHLFLDLDTEGGLQGHMNYLRDTPLGENLRDFMKVAEFSGSSGLKLKLDVPLSKQELDTKGVSVDGLIDLHDNRFAIPEYNQIFTKLNGSVHFDQYGVDVQNAAGIYQGQPVMLAASTDKSKNLITVKLQQHNDPTIFLPETLTFLKPYIHGKTDVETWLELPSFGKKKSTLLPVMKIRAKSHLQGITIDLPPPLAKTANASRELLVDLELPFDSANPWDIAVHMDKLLGVRASLPHKGKQRAAISIGLGENQIPKPEVGIQVTGTIDEFNLFDLQGFSKGQENTKSPALAPIPVKANVDIGELWLGEQSLGKASLSATGADIIKAIVRADKAQAILHLPVRNTASGRINLDLAGIDLDKLDGGLHAKNADHGNTLSPKNFPSMRFICKDCRKGDFPIQQLTLNMNKSRHDLQIETLDIRNPLLVLSAEQGRWYDDANGNSRTELTATAYIPQPGKLLAEQGSEAGLQGGGLNATASLHWQGAPFSFSLAGLNGELQARMDKGNLTEVEPGLGRLLGLLDIQRLPSRLSMDFRDMTGKGVAFDEITGTFQLKNGVLTTQNTIIKAAIMVAGIQGSTDLVHKTHDQTVTVIPNLKSTLPLLGAAVGGLGGGVAMLLFSSATEKSAEDKLNSSGGFRYRVTGSWQEPDIVEIKATNR